MITFTDLFAGAGGSSTGAAQVPGVEVRIAANHWAEAVDVHNANHPNADHICADISQYDPRRIPSTAILWASPECTNHAGAKGIARAAQAASLFEAPDEAAARSRATMWDVPRFAEVHRYQAVIVENVVEAARWLPFQAWLMAMHSLGYEHRTVWLNSMHANRWGAPAPQSRDRMYVVFWRAGNRAPDLEAMQRPRAHCPACGIDVDAMQAWKNPAKRWGRYRAQYVYRCPSVSCRHQVVEPYWLPAAAAIDWSLPGTRIGDRTRPLAAKTRARIAAGIERYWRPFTLEAAGRNETGILTPSGGTWNETAEPTSEPLRALTTREAYGLVTHDEPVTDAEVDDCLFRMLEPHEIAAGMAFPHDYIWQGTKRSRVRMAGNAVTPPAARDLVAAVVDSLETAA